MATDENFKQIQDVSTLRPDLDYAVDLGVVNGFLNEQAHLYFPQIVYYRLDFDQTETDDLYQETKYRAYFEEQQFPVTLVWDPPERRLKKFGIDSKRDLEVTMFASILSEYNLNPKVGDMFKWEDAWYEITEISRSFHYAASNKNTVYTIFANQTKLREVPDHKFETLFGLEAQSGDVFITQSGAYIVVYKKTE